MPCVVNLTWMNSAWICFNAYKNPRNGTCHWAVRIILRIKINSRNGTRARVALCCHVFAWNIFTNRHDKLSNARKPSAAPVRVSLCGLFGLNFEAPCRFPILIMSLIRENWAINWWNERLWLENAKTERNSKLTFNAMLWGCATSWIQRRFIGLPINSQLRHQRIFYYTPTMPTWTASERSCPVIKEEHVSYFEIGMNKKPF